MQRSTSGPANRLQLLLDLHLTVQILARFVDCISFTMGSSGPVELGYLFANQVSSFDLSGASNIFPENFTSVPNAEPEPAWNLSSQRCPDPIYNMFPQIKFPQQTPYQNTKPAVHPSFNAAPIYSAFNQALDSRCPTEFLQFKSCQLNSLPLSPAIRSLEEKMFCMKQEGSSFPTAINSQASMLFSRKHGNLGAMAKMTPREVMEAKALAASKSHSEAERRRRCRINTHLATLRSMLPSTTKTDKAYLLAEVVQHLKELKRLAAEISIVDPVPSDVDEVSVEIDQSFAGNCVQLVRASLCCDDRPGLLSDLIRTLRSLSLQIMKAEMAMLGGRVNISIMLTNALSASAKQDGSFLSSVQEALQAVVAKSCSSEITPNFEGKRKKGGYGNNGIIPFEGSKFV